MFPEELAEQLRAQGHDVLRAREIGLDRADDRQILERAMAEGRILITLDEHFGDWVVLPLRRHPGVIRVKLHPPRPLETATLLHPLLSRRAAADFKNRLVILSARRVRWINTA